MDIARCTKKVGALMCGNLASAFIPLDAVRYREPTKFALSCPEHARVLSTEFEVAEGAPADFEWRT